LIILLDFRVLVYTFAPMISNILYDLIRTSGKTQAKLAKAMDISPQLFNYMIKNPKKLNTEQIELLATALKKSPRNLFSLIINN